MAEIYQFAKFYLPISYSLAIRQTLTPQNIPAIRYTIMVYRDI